MDKERINIKLQRHLRPLTTSSKEKVTASSNRGGTNRPVTAAPSVMGGTSGKSRAGRVTKNSLRESHLQAFRTGSGEFVGPGGDGEGEVIPAVAAICQHGRHQAVENSSKPVEEEEVCPQLADVPETEPTEPKHPTFESWLTGYDHSSDEFDTDVEDDVETPMSSFTASDPTGKIEYEEQCRKHGFVPVSYLCRHIGDRNVRMRHRYLGGTATKPLALAFKQNTVTENLDLSDNYIEGSGTTYIANMLKENHFIISLNLSNNFIGSPGAEAIAEMLETNTTLKVLSLAGNQLNDKDAYFFIQPLKNNMSLASLDLSHNEFSVMGGIHLGGGLGANDGIVDLDLSWNCLRKDGAVAIASSLRLNTTLEVLDLSWNGFGVEGATALAKSLQTNSTLKVLDLTNNRIDCKAAQKLVVGLKKNKGLETLILNMNPLGHVGVEQILKSLTSHQSMHFLGLEEIGLSRANVEAAQDLEKSTGIIVMHGGVNGHDRSTLVSNVTRLFNQFRSRKRTELRDLFRQHDEDKSGKVQIDDVKLCLRAAGLNLTNRFMDVLLENMDSTHQGHLNYRSILSGEVFSEHSRRRPSRGFKLLNNTKLEDPDSEGD